VVQFKPIQQPLTAIGNVHLAVSGESQGWPFAAIAPGAKADPQFAFSSFLTWLAPVQRKPPVMNIRLREVQHVTMPSVFGEPIGYGKNRNCWLSAITSYS
jgi:hypothetical protein